MGNYKKGIVHQVKVAVGAQVKLPQYLGGGTAKVLEINPKEAKRKGTVKVQDSQDVLYVPHKYLISSNVDGERVSS